MQRFMLLGLVADLVGISLGLTLDTAGLPVLQTVERPAAIRSDP